jgi:hypothetical protein
MCNLENEPWRANFTGPNCRCGVPTAGTPEEESIEKEKRAEATNKRTEEHKIELARKYGTKLGNLYLPS